MVKFINALNENTHKSDKMRMKIFHVFISLKNIDS